MTYELWQELRGFVKWTSIEDSEDMLIGALAWMVVRGLGRINTFLRMCPVAERSSPESAVIYAISSESRLQGILPSIGHLGTEIIKTVQHALETHSIFNFPMMLQGENLPSHIAKLQEKVMQDERSLKFYLFATVGMMCGLLGTTTSSIVGSKYMDNNNGR